MGLLGAIVVSMKVKDWILTMAAFVGLTYVADFISAEVGYAPLIWLTDVLTGGLEWLGVGAYQSIAELGRVMGWW